MPETRLTAKWHDVNFIFAISLFPAVYSPGLKNVCYHTVSVAYYHPVIFICYFIIFLFGAKYYKVQHTVITND
jgi:hypothetical protein